jgi:hypothetical protein
LGQNNEKRALLHDRYESELWGQRLMYDACAHNSDTFMGEFKDGFHQTQRDGGTLALFDECARDDQGRLYGIGRGFMGEAAATLRNRGIPVGGLLLEPAERTKKKN